MSLGNKKTTPLSPKELKILKLTCNEKTNKEIAKALKMGISTVELHKSNIYRKTKAKTIVGLVVFAIKNGITKVD